MIAKKHKHFCVTFTVSLVVHLLALTLLFTIPHASFDEGYKKVSVKLGTGKLKMADDLANARKYAAFEPGAGLYNQKAVNGNSDKNLPAIVAKDQDDAPQEKAELQKLLASDNVGIKKSNEEKNEKAVFANKSPVQVKKIQKITKKEEAVAPKPIQNKAEMQPDDGESTLIGNSLEDGAEKLASYEQMLPLWLEKFKTYPKAVYSAASGEIFIKIDRKGKILLSKIIKTTGNNDLDKAIAKMITDADPVLPVPLEYHPYKKTFSYKIAIAFEEQKNVQ